MVRYASRAPSMDHQWATYVRSTSSVSEENQHHQYRRPPLRPEPFLVKPEGIPTFISPVGEPVHDTSLLISTGQAQRSAGHALHVVDISVEHVRLEETRRVAGFISGCGTSGIIPERINHRPAHSHGREPIPPFFPSGCAAEQHRHSSITAAKTQRRRLEQDETLSQEANLCYRLMIWGLKIFYGRKCV